MRRTMPHVRHALVALLAAASVTACSAATAAARPWLGVYTQEVTGDLRDGLDLHENGVLVNRVIDDSPADHAGLRKGDVIVRFNSRGVDSPEELAQLVGDSRDGQEVALDIVRDGSRRTLTVTLADRPSQDDEGMNAPEPPTPPTPPSPPDVRTPDDHAAPQGDRNDEDMQQLRRDARRMAREMRMRNPGMMSMQMGRGRLGVTVMALNDDLADALGVRAGRGVFVTNVMQDTPASRAGLRAGDVILRVNGSDVANVEELQRALANEDHVTLSVSRRGERRTVEADLGSRSDRDDQEVTPGPGQGRMMMRMRDQTSDTDELKQQIEDLKQQVKELRQQLQEERDRR